MHAQTQAGARFGKQPCANAETELIAQRQKATILLPDAHCTGRNIRQDHKAK
jgi:hypothetical protein